jgi:hypothetical protein
MILHLQQPRIDWYEDDILHQGSMHGMPLLKNMAQL